MILVLEEVDLFDHVYEDDDYHPASVSISDFEMDPRVIENARLVTFRIHENGGVKYRDLKNRDGSVSNHNNNHPWI